jgi:2-dehydro-3-deoxyphosphogluconate aldolase/(4S)-4-hydroxy-2-oxoglutarate aldolase
MWTAAIPDLAGPTEAHATNAVRCGEFTFTTPGVLDAIRDASGSCQGWVGTGTVLDVVQAESASLAGAKFVVAPVLKPDLVGVSHRARVAVCLGGFSPTELLLAVDAGADSVKLFPASIGGPEYLKDSLSPFPNLKLITSAGVTVESASPFLEAGGVTLFVGSHLAPSRLVTADRYEEVGRRARESLEALKWS